MRFLKALVVFVASASCTVLQPPIYRRDIASVRGTTRRIVENLVGVYNQAPTGNLPAPYWWWEAGGLLNGFIEYWHYTGDAQYNDLVTRGILSQTGPGNNFRMPPCEGNDDQGWWALAAMSAAEYGLPSPPGAPSWLQLAQNVHNEFVSRWDHGRCNGGMKWQIEPNRPGYNYKSTVANGLFFQLAARLARFTGNQDYLRWAEKSWDWTRSVGLIDDRYNVFDGTDDAKGSGCIDVNHDQWSYNTGVFMYGAAILADHTRDEKWRTRTISLVGSAGNFYENMVMYEKMCEREGKCNTDQLSFKAYLARYLAGTAVLHPDMQGMIVPFLQASANGAAAACNGQTCGSRWYTNGHDGIVGVGQSMAAMEVMHGLFISEAQKPGTLRRKVRRYSA